MVKHKAAAIGPEDTSSHCAEVDDKTILDNVKPQSLVFIRQTHSLVHTDRTVPNFLRSAYKTQDVILGRIMEVEMDSCLAY
jgi:hypothetical protein